MALLAEAYLHRLDPFAIEFPQGWPIAGIRWYGLAYLAGFLVGWGIVKWMARTHRTALPPQSVGDLVIWVLVGVLVGGRLGYCIFYEPALLVSVTGDFPFWGLLAINRGGMASHGGILGVILALSIFAHRHHLSKLHLLDVAALTCAPGLFFGRIANFVNGELPGEPLPADRQADPPWWSIKYPEGIHDWIPGEPGKLADLGPAVEAVGFDPAEFGIHVERMAADESSRTLIEQVCRHVVEAARAGNEQVIETIRPLLDAFYPSQIIQAITDGPLLAGAMLLAWWGPRKPGIVGGWFLLAYGVLRILSEFVRQPDEGVATIATPLGELARGQVLSVLMVVIGAVGLVIVARREVEPIGGLVRPKEAPEQE